MRLGGICGLILGGLIGQGLAWANQPLPTRPNPCAAAVTRPAQVTAADRHNLPNRSLFQNLRLGVTNFKYPTPGRSGYFFSAKAFLAGRTDLLPVRWQVLRLVVHQIWMDHLRRHNWWSGGQPKPQLNYGGLSPYWTQMVERGVESLINQTFDGLASFGPKAAAARYDKGDLNQQLQQQRQFLDQHKGAKEEGLQAEFIIPGEEGGKLLIDGEFWPKIKKWPELYQDFVQQLSKVWGEKLNTGWVQEILQEIFAKRPPEQTFKQLAYARFAETTAILALIQVLGQPNVHQLSAAEAKAKYAAFKAALQTRSEIMILALLDRPYLNRPWAYQLIMMQITNPQSLVLPEKLLPELKKELGNDLTSVAWPLQQFAINLTPEEQQVWREQLAHTTQVGRGIERDIYLNRDDVVILRGIQNHFTRAKQRRWDHWADQDKASIINDIGLVDKALHIMQAHHQDYGTKRQLPVALASYQMTDILFVSPGSSCAVYYFNFGSLPFYNRLKIKVE